MRYTSAVKVSAKECPISFETASQCKELEHGFLLRVYLYDSWTLLSLTYIMTLCVKQKRIF